MPIGCRRCGNQAAENDLYCSRCGQWISFAGVPDWHDENHPINGKNPEDIPQGNTKSVSVCREVVPVKDRGSNEFHVWEFPFYKPERKPIQRIGFFVDLLKSAYFPGNSEGYKIESFKVDQYGITILTIRGPVDEPVYNLPVNLEIKLPFFSFGMCRFQLLPEPKCALDFGRFVCVDQEINFTYSFYYKKIGSDKYE